MKKAVIFDMDGVLVDTNPIHAMAWKKALVKYGIDFDEQFYTGLLGLSRRDQMEKILAHSGVILSAEQKENLLVEKNELAVKKLSKLSGNDLDPDVTMTLKALKEKGIRMAVASSSVNAGMIIRNTGIISYMDVVCDGTGISRAKPDPELFIKARKALGLDPQFCLIVEDAKAGIQAATAAGIESCGIGAAALYCRTDHPIMKVSDILKYLD